MSTVWSDHLADEVGFWRRWFTEDPFKTAREQRLEFFTIPYPDRFTSQLGAKPGETLRFLDVGSGPVSTLRGSAETHPVDLVCVDALADLYNDLLEEFGYGDLPRIVQCKGEDLVEHFGEDNFHLVNIANALDHCEDPTETFRQMYRVCRPGGRIAVTSIENEGEREAYSGLHQWNLRASDDGFFLWNPGMTTNLLDELPGSYEYEWQYQPGTGAHFRSFRVELRKTA